MSSYFGNNNKRGELQELNEELNSTNLERKQDAVKKVIAHMTVGKDVSPLFQSVIKCLEYPEVEMKKLIYLYIINYSKTKPDDAIMVVNLFRQDVLNKANPLIRALAVRTMGCLRVHQLNEYLVEPLKDVLNDPEPYVRKTAVLCLPQVYEVSQELVENAGLIDLMQKLLQKEGNPLVIANLIVSLSQIANISGRELIILNQALFQKLILAINECMDWGQVFIMDYLINYIPDDSREAEGIIERVLPRLSHRNPAVVFSAVQVIVKFMDHITSQEIIQHLCKKVTPSLVSLLSWDKPEIKFVLLKCILHIIDKRPNILDNEVKYFFIGFNEPFYIKYEKLEILSKIVDIKNQQIVLNELREYLNESDPTFVRKAVKSLTSIALRFEKSIDGAISILVAQIKNLQGTQGVGDQYVQEIIISMQKIFRKYPKQIEHEKSLLELVEILGLAFEPKAKASAVWILGEFAEFIPQVIEYLQERIENFKSEQRSVQLEILTAAIQIFVKYPDEGQVFIKKILETASYETQNPDVRDRAFLYWRMLSSDPEKTKRTILNPKPDIIEEIIPQNKEFLEKMIDTLGLVSAVEGKIPESLFPKLPQFQRQLEREKLRKLNQEDYQEASPQEEVQREETSPNAQPTSVQNDSKSTQEVDLLGDQDFGQNDNNVAQTGTNVNQPKPATNVSTGTGNLLDLDDSPKTKKQTNNAFPSFNQTENKQAAPVSTNLFDIFATNVAPSHSQLSTNVPLQEIINPLAKGTSGQIGVQLDGAFARENNQILIKFKLYNSTPTVITQFISQLKPNFFGLQIDGNPPVINILPGMSSEFHIVLSKGSSVDPTPPPVPLNFTLGVKLNYETYYCVIPCMFHTLFSETGTIDQDEFRNIWKQIPDANELSFDALNIQFDYKNQQILQSHLHKNNIFFIASRDKETGQSLSYYSAQSTNDIIFLIQIAVPSLKSPTGATIAARSLNNNVTPLVLQCVNFLLTR